MSIPGIPCQVVQNGQPRDAFLSYIMKGGVARKVASFLGVYGNLTPPPPPPPPTQTRRVGIYHGGPSTDNAVRTSFGAYPQIASTYYQENQSNGNVTEETTRINKGISPLLTITARGTQRLAGIASGNAADLAWLDQWVAFLHTLSQVNPNIPVYGTIDHEHEVKANQGVLTGASATASVYGEVLSVFFEKCNANAPAVQHGYWYGDYDTAAIAARLAAIRIPPKFIAGDPYANSAGENSVNTLFRVFASWLRSNSNYARLGSPPIGIAEYGARDDNHTDSQLAGFYGGTRQALIDNNMVFAVFFNRDRDTPYLITDGVHPLAVAAMGSQFTP